MCTREHTHSAQCSGCVTDQLGTWQKWLAQTQLLQIKHCFSAATDVSAHQQRHNWPMPALNHESQDVFTLLSMPIKQLGMSLLMPEKSGLNSAWASMCD